VASRFTRNWEIVRGERSLNEQRVATYVRLMDAQERIAQALSRHGVSDARIDEALGVSELDSSEAEPEDDLYLGSLARYVGALGGHLEVRAVFPDETITVRRDPDDLSRPDPA
jgi:hypothetical protein